MSGSTFKGPGLQKTQDIHAEFFEIFGEDELAGRVRAGEGFSVAGKDIDCLFGESASDVLNWLFSHPCCS